MKEVLLVSDGVFHPPFMGRVVLKRVLVGMVGYRFRGVRSMEVLPGDLKKFQALVVYFHHASISEKAIQIFDEYVSSGGGVLAIHSATASSKGNRAFTDILGGRFKGHGPVQAFEMGPVSPESEIFAGIPTFDVVDELYLHDLQADIQVHFISEYEGAAIPTVWTRFHGAGRVCYACPGHRTASMRVDAYQEVLMRGLAWVCNDAHVISQGHAAQSI
jgi:type 1 glutamine amidotransferase